MTAKQELIARPAANVPTPMPRPESPIPTFSFQELQRMADSFAKSGLYGIKNADQAFALMMEAQAQNKHPALIMRDYDMIGNRLSKKSGAMLRDFQASGGRVEWQELTDARAAALFSHPLCAKPVLIDWDMERAKKAGLTGKDGGMYTKYTRAMLRSRCISEGIRSTAPEATENMYTAEELIAIQESEAPAPVSETAAIEQAVTAQTVQETDEFVNSMDVKTLPELETAFANAWRSTKDPKARDRYKAVYEDMKEEIARVAAEKGGA